MRVKVACETWTGRTPFDPNGRFEKRTFEIEADSLEHAKRLFGEAVEAGIENVKGSKLLSVVEAD